MSGLGVHYTRVRRTAIAATRYVHAPGDLPGIVIIGAQKAGTTTLFHALRQHPDVKKARAKELHFADRYWGFGLGWYRRCFPKGPGIGLEATPNYLFYPKAAERLASVLPETKFIAILRDPVGRAFSHYNYLKKLGHRLPAFGEMIAREAALDNAWRQAETTGAWSLALQRDSVLRRGLYGAQLQKWYAQVGPERLLVLEDRPFYEDPAAVLAEVQSFLGLTQTELKVGHHNANTRSAPEADTAALRAHFHADGQLLQGLTGRGFSWID